MRRPFLQGAETNTSLDDDDACLVVLDFPLFVCVSLCAGGCLEKFKFSVLPFSSENFRLLLGRERGKTGKLLTQVEVRKSTTTGLELGAGWGGGESHTLTQSRIVDDDDGD